MINSNVLKSVSAALEAHGTTTLPNERMGDTVARGLGISGAEAERWLEALDDGCTIEQANKRAGIVVTTENEPVLVTIARSLGEAAARLHG